MAIRASTYRLDEATIDLIDRLGDRLGGIDRTAVIRIAVRRLADAELPDTPDAQKIARKTSKKKQ